MNTLNGHLLRCPQHALTTLTKFTMPETLPRWMTEVTRLTRLGKLAEAAQAIQQALGRQLLPLPTASAPSAHSDVVENGVAEWLNTVVDTTPAARAPANAERSTFAGSHSEAGLTREYLLDASRISWLQIG